MTNLIDVAAHRSRAVLMVLVFVLIAGVIAYNGVPKESAPDVQIPVIYVSMSLEGISPEDAERLLIRPMEKKLQSIENVKHMTAEAEEGFASVSLEFSAGFNSEKALADVRSKVDEAKAELPADAEEPTVHEVNLSLFPVVNVILTGDVPERALMAAARNLREKIEALPVVLEANLAGDREEVLEIIIDPSTLEVYRLNPADVLTRVRANNQLIAAGELDTGSGRFGIKLPGLIEDYKDLMSIPLINNDTTVVTLSDVASVRRTFKDRTVSATVNGSNAIGIGVSKRTGANIIDSVKAVREIVAKEQQFWPAGIKVVFSQDNSGEIKNMLSDLENSVLLAILLVTIVIMLVMGTRAAAMVAFAVPGAFLIGVLTIAVLGLTMNIVVLFSLILSVGLLVDSAIVVSEYGDRKIREGASIGEAYVMSAKRMAWPIIASTITTLVVFLPLLFWPGTVGQFMKYMPVTLIATLSGSLLMALIFIPVLGLLVSKRRHNNGTADTVDNDDAMDYGGVTIRYEHMLNKILKRPKAFVAAICSAVVIVIAAFVMFGAGVEFFPDIEPNNASVLIRAQGNYSVSQMEKVTEDVMTRIGDMTDDIDIFYVKAGKVSERNMPGDTIGIIQLEFANWQQRRPVEEILTDIKRRTADMKGVVIETQKQKEGPPTGKNVQLEFRSRFPELIVPEVKKFKAAMKDIGGFRNVEDDLPVPKIEWEFEVNRELAGRNNISTSDIGQMLRFISNGVKVNEYRPDDADDEIDIIARFPESDRSLSQLESLRIGTPDGLVPISNFITKRAKQATGTVHRMDGQRVHNVKADVEEGILPAEKLKEVAAWLRQANIDPRVQIVFRGEDEEQKEAGAFLSGAFLIALFLMCLILVAQFNSVKRMIAIVSAVALSTGGVMLGLLITGKPFGIVMCGVGVISLAGIVVNNNIILIDTYKLLLDKGLTVREALIRAGCDRLRPILLTAGTTVLGLLPMVMAMNVNFFNRTISFGAPSTQWWIQLSTSIAGGLTFATILTLFFTPCLLLIMEGRKK